MAIGAFYRPNEDTMFSVATSMGNRENMINGGISLRFGSSNGMVTNSRVAMAKEIVDLKAKVDKLSDENTKILSLLKQLTGLNINEVEETSQSMLLTTYFKINRIKGKETDKYTVERIHVNDDDRDNEHRSSYGTILPN